MSAYAATQSKTDAQAAGLAIGTSTLTTGTLSPSTTSQTATTAGAGNVWGASYTGTADSTLTGKQGSTSMIGLGNKATTDASQNFNGYNQSRDDQGSQATYFLNKHSVLKPTFSSNDPMFRTDNLKTPDVFASSSATNCKQKTTSTTYDNTEKYACTQSYNPYVLSCADTLNVTASRVLSCTVGKQYSVSIGDSTGMGDDGCDGGDGLIAQWTCTTDDFPSISMNTNSKPYGLVGGTVANSGMITVNISGSCDAQLKNTTTCTNGQCSGTYTMILGTNVPTYIDTDQCKAGYYTASGYDQDGNYYSYQAPGYVDPSGNLCNRVVSKWTFTEHSFGAASRLVAKGTFSMSKFSYTSNTTSSCAPLEGLSQP